MSKPSVEIQDLEMVQAIGACLMAWANVEFQLGWMFVRYHGGSNEVPTIVWSTIISFDARITLLQRILKTKFTDGPAASDIDLLLNETRRLYKQRNEVAHATMMLMQEGDGLTAVLEPFFVLGTDRPKLSASDVRARRDGFAQLANSLDWLHTNQLIPWPSSPPTQHLAFQRPPTDLVLELRDKQARKSKEHSERQKLLRHALRLVKQKRLPDWPPEGES